MAARDLLPSAMFRGSVIAGFITRTDLVAVAQVSIVEMSRDLEQLR